MLVVNGKEVFTTLEELVNPRHTALLLIDLQNDFIMPGGAFDKQGKYSSALHEIVPNVKRVLEAARHSGVLVVHVQFTCYPDFLVESPVALHQRLLRTGYTSGDTIEKLVPDCIQGTWGWQVVDELAPLPNEVVVMKHRQSAFIGTDLDMILRSNGIKSVCIVGLVTQGCVLATATDAVFFEYYPVILRDCVGSRKPTVHEAALLVMSSSKDITSSEKVLEIWYRSTS